MSDASELKGVYSAIALYDNPADPDGAARAGNDALMLKSCIEVFSNNENRNDQLYEIYEGTVALHKVPTIVPERYKKLRVGCPWPEIAVQSVVERSRFEGFVFPEETEDTDRMAALADRCEVTLGYQSGLTDSLIAGVSFATVGRDENGACLRWHTAQSAAGIWDYANGRLRCGFAIVDRCRKKVATSGDEHWDTVPSQVDFYTAAGVWELSREDATSPWAAEWLPDPMGEPRMVALVFRPDGRHPLGRSRFTVPMRGIVQEYMANALNLHVASEFTAVGQKWATGLSDEQLQVFAANKWGASADTVVLATDNPDTGGNPQFGNFTQQSMEPVLSVKRSLATDFAAAASIPVSELLTQDSNPTSAEAITAMENRLISLVECVNARNERTLRKLALMLMATEEDKSIAELTDAQKAVMVHMRSPQTVSAAGQSDAMLKRIQSIPYLAESDVAIEELGFTTDQIARLKSDRDRYVTKQAVAQAAQAAGLDLSGEPEVAE
jgi:hypothetical protein